MPRRYRILGIAAIVALVLDQVSKWAVMQFIPEHRPITVIAGLFDLVNIRNRGAAFGFLNRSDIEWQFWLFLAATVVAVWAIVMLVRLLPSQKNCPLQPHRKAVSAFSVVLASLPMISIRPRFTSSHEGTGGI